MRTISENDLRWFAARLSIAVEDTKRFGGMSVHELKQGLAHVPGAESLTVSYAPNGDELVTIAGRTLDVRPDASNEDIAAAFLTLPTVPFSNVTTTRTAPMSITGAAGATLSIKDIISKSRATVQAAHEKLATNAGKVATAAAALDSLGDDLGKEGDDLMAMIGQFKNSLGGETA